MVNRKVNKRDRSKSMRSKSMRRSQAMRQTQGKSKRDKSMRIKHRQIKPKKNMTFKKRKRVISKKKYTRKNNKLHGGNYYNKRISGGADTPPPTALHVQSSVGVFEGKSLTDALTDLDGAIDVTDQKVNSLKTKLKDAEERATREAAVAQEAQAAQVKAEADAAAAAQEAQAAQVKAEADAAAAAQEAQEKADTAARLQRKADERNQVAIDELDNQIDELRNGGAVAAAKCAEELKEVTKAYVEAHDITARIKSKVIDINSGLTPFETPSLASLNPPPPPPPP